MVFMDELEVILGKARDITDTGIKKADEVIKVSKLKMECVKLDNEIKAKYAALGKTVYGMVKNDSASAEKIASYVLSIDALYKRIARLQGRIEQAKKIVTCPNCGTKNKYDNMYCAGCSHRLMVTDEEPEDYN